MVINPILKADNSENVKRDCYISNRSYASEAVGRDEVSTRSLFTARGWVGVGGVFPKSLTE